MHESGCHTPLLSLIPDLNSSANVASEFPEVLMATVPDVKPEAVTLTNDEGLCYTRYLINDACVLTGKPNVYGSIFRFEGQASVFATEDGPCYRCLYPEPPPPGLVPSCAEGGVLGILPGLVGVIQATETIKLILGAGDPLIGRLLLIDALGMKFRELKLRKNPDCPACGKNPTITKLIDYQEFCGIRGEEVEAEVTSSEMRVEELKQRLDRGDDLYILDVREPHEYQICNLGGHLIPLGDLPNRVN